MNTQNNVINPANMEEGIGAQYRESTIPVTGGRKTWISAENMSYSINNTDILKGVDVVIPPGKLVALMGPSGAGKTTLLNALSCRSYGKVEGNLTINGHPITPKIMKREAKMVPQCDVLEPVLTASETLRYTAELSLELPKAEREARVEEIINTLSLQSCADVFVGNSEKKGMSGGQLKRVSIGMELLSNPSCLFLDEPTSGLDSKIAEDVVDLLCSLAHGGRAVCVTIHQPSYQVFSKFDWLVMLDEGRVAYNGEVSGVSRYLQEIGSPCPEFVNPADHLMFVLSQPVEDPKCTSYHDVFRSSSFAQLADSEMHRGRMQCERFVDRIKDLPDSDPAKAIQSEHDEGYPTSFWNQFSVVLRRAFYVTCKDRGQLRSRFAQLIFIGLIFGTIWFQTPADQSRAQDKLSVMFLCILFLGMSSIMSTSLAIPAEKAVLCREYANGYFSMPAYFIARMLVLWAFQFLYSFIFSAALYYMIGFYSPFANFVTFVAGIVIISLISGTVGYGAGILFPTVQQAAAMVPMLVMPLSIFAGLFIPYDSIPVYWSWLYWLSMFMWDLRILAVNEWGSSYFNACTVEQIQNPQLGLCPYGACSDDPLNPQPCPGTVMLDRLGYDEGDLGRSFGILVGIWAAFFFLGMLAMHRLLKKMR
mmetsp:Transcript_28140/g.45187  ORF Transcript_28140/g.45187 Transcript_28140/m.45187 type:complete len:647 (+) Transcript_28140:291-2231(+)